MQEDFHYYATYCAAFLAGFTHEQSKIICYSAQFVDLCSRTFLDGVGGPKEAATTQLMLEMLDAKTDLIGLQNITRIWASFHFLPFDLYNPIKHRKKKYKNKYRMICNSNGALVADTVNLAKGKTLQAVGLAMHVLADTWAHKYFAGTPTLVINNTTDYFFELIEKDGAYEERKLQFTHNPKAKDDIDNSIYVNTIYQYEENTVMNLGHGRVGHLPDLSFIRYKYMPAWGNYREIVKDNPDDYMHAFAQMVYAMRYLRGLEGDRFELNKYAWDVIEPYKDRLKSIIETRRLDASEDWKAFGEELSGAKIPAFDLSLYQEEYKMAEKENKNNTFLGGFFLAAIAQKSMVTKAIFTSKNPLAGIALDYNEKGLRGIKDYLKLMEYSGLDLTR